MTAVFLDSNILVYAYSADARSDQARQILRGDYVIGVQTLNEFTYVARRKLKFSWEKIARASLDLSETAEAVVSTQLDDHQQSLRLADRHDLQIFDALMLALALRAGCQTFYSEDMHPGLVIDNRLTIINPFL